MRLETILNRVEKHPSFVYGSSQLEDGASGLALVVRLRPRRNGSAGGVTGRRTTTWRSVGSSTRRCGGSRCSSRIGCVG